MNILVLSWNPGIGLNAGGFRYNKELLERKPKNVSIDILDVYPTYFNKKKINVFEYKIPGFILGIKKFSLVFERFLEWSYVFFYLLFKASKFIKSKKYDFIYVPYGELFFLSFSGSLIKIFQKVRYINCILNVSVIGDNFTANIVSFFHLVLRWFILKSLNFADFIFTCSNDLKSKINHVGFNGDVNVVPVGFEVDKYLVIPKKKVYDAVSIGRFSSEKGIFDLIDVWRLVVKNKKDAKLLIIGAGDKMVVSQLKKLISDFGLTGNVLLAGSVSESKKFDYICKSKLLLFLSHIEGWGIVPFEALACGLPVVAYDLSVYKETIKHCSSVFLLGRNFSLISKRVINLIDNYSNYINLSKNFVKDFSWKPVVKDFFNKINSLF